MADLPVRADFVRDVGEQLAARLRVLGVSVPGATPPADVAAQYYDYGRRQIPARPRKVILSREMQAKALPRQEEAGVHAVMEDAAAGRELWPYLRKPWRDLSSHDLLFNDWGVHHMHLGGRTLLPGGFVKRSGPLLFVWAAPSELYLLDVLNHGDWGDQRIVQILHDNWPALIEHAKARGVRSCTLYSDASRKTLSRNRKGCNFNLPVSTSDGTVYVAINGGFVGSGLGLDSRRWSDYILNFAVELQRQCVADREKIGRYVARRSNLGSVELRLALLLRDESEFVVHEERSGLDVLRWRPEVGLPSLRAAV
jgi:hypothetical protein